MGSPPRVYMHKVIVIEMYPGLIIHIPNEFYTEIIVIRFDLLFVYQNLFYVNCRMT